MPRFENLYHLVQAYDRLGQHLYSTSWTGDEISAYCPVPVEEATRHRENVESKIRGIEDRLKATNAAIDRETARYIIADLTKERDQLESALAPLQDELWKLPVVNDDYRTAFEKVQRRDYVKGMILAAIGNGSLEATIDGSMVWQPDRFMEGRDYKLYFEQSLIVQAKRHGHKRRASIFIERGKFETWLKKQEPFELSDDDPRMRERRFIDYFREQILLGRKGKPYFKDIARTQFNIGKNQFERIWDEEAPPEWRRKGRIPDSKKLPQ